MYLLSLQSENTDILKNNITISHLLLQLVEETVYLVLERGLQCENTVGQLLCSGSTNWLSKDCHHTQADFVVMPF